MSTKAEVQIRAAVPHDLPAVQALLREADLPLDGVADQVARDRLRWARNQGLSSVVLLTTAAGGYFQRLGFVPPARDNVPSELRTSSEFASVCPANAAVLTLALEDRSATH